MLTADTQVSVAVTMQCYCDCGAGRAPGVCCEAMPSDMPSQPAVGPGRIVSAR